MPPPPQNVFDQSHYVKLIETRGEAIRRVVDELKSILGLSSALDAGCGVGFFSQILKEAHLHVVAFDGRAENVEEARNRYAGIPFHCADIEKPETRDLGQFDLVLCFGLLYHLESPMLAIRNLRALTRKGLLIESMCFPDAEPWMLLRDESSQEDQSLTHLAFYCSEGCLIKMLYRAGFTAVYRLRNLPEHDDFRDAPSHVRRRTILFASPSTLNLQSMVLVPEFREPSDPWEKNPSPTENFSRRLMAFWAKPMRAKLAAIRNRVKSLTGRRSSFITLPFGARWTLKGSTLDQTLLSGSFEPSETRFVKSFLRPGMVVLDVGAHHGYYSLLAAACVGPTGRVFAFEPSPRERVRLEKHLRINRRGNVLVEPTALAASTGQMDLFLVEGADDYCNSLRPPVVNARTNIVPVHTETLDGFLSRNHIKHVDFIKLDVEGAELDVLRGAANLLTQPRRPVFMVEVYDIRTEPWSYRAREIVRLLNQAGYEWFGLRDDGVPQPIDADLDRYDKNLVAVPGENLQLFLDSLQVRT